MKIVHITKYLPLYMGGIERATHVMADAAARMGYQVKTIGVGQKKRGNRDMPKIGEEVALRSYGKIGPLELAPGYFTLWKHIKDADIVHIHTPHPLAEIALIYWGLLGRLLNFKCAIVPVIHAPLTEIPLMTKLWRILYPFFFKNADAVISASDHLLKSAKEFIKTPENKYFIPWPSNSPAPIPGVLKNKKISMLIVGRLVSYKGHLVLLNALSKLGGDWQLNIVGTGPEELIIRKTILDLGLTDKISMLGGISDADKSVLLHSCDIFIAPSITSQEGYGIVIAEAMAHGKPVVATDIPTAMQFLVRGGDCGAKVRAGSAEDLVIAIKTLIDDDERRKTIGENNREFWENNLTIDAYSESYKVAVESIMKIAS